MLKYPPLLLLFSITLIFLSACGREAPPKRVLLVSPENGPEQPTQAQLAVSLAGGWTRIAPGGETTCAHGTEYAFWVRPGASEDLLVYFQGGGGCWDAETCAPGSTFFDSSVTTRDSPEARGGIFDFDHPDNPFADYNMVYIPSCTGDVHWGESVQRFPNGDGSELTVHFNGFANGRAALDWAYQNFPRPASVFVTGCSAGSVGSAAHVPYIIERHPGIPVAQLGDSLAFVFHRPLNLTGYGTYNNFPAWIPGLETLQPAGFTMAGYYSELANYYPDYIFSQYNTAADHVQDRYYQAVGGQPGDFPDDLARSLDEIHTQAPNFFSYVAGGDAHCIMPLDRFYTYAANGVRFRDWVTDLAAGAPVESVRCADCSVAETVSP
ncbi:MAG: pectin acetylesterase-family hydrolase [Anaerolineales bacterium]|nr:pectin acetylesterase-family hydrolase [Anaerolineales bacterium]